MMDWLREFKLPAAAVIALCAAFVSGYAYLHTSFVSAASFDVYQNQIERRIHHPDRSRTGSELAFSSPPGNGYSVAKKTTG